MIKLDWAIYIFVEGDNDHRFFTATIKPELEKKYKNVKIIPYARQKRSTLQKFITGVRKNHPYIFVADLDKHECYTKKKKDILLHRAQVEPDRIAIVKPEIESWYVAGLKQNDAQSLNIVYRTNTEPVTKNEFDRMWLGKFMTKNDFLLEILNRFSMEMAKKNNSSFAYFCDRYL